MINRPERLLEPQINQYFDDGAAERYVSDYLRHKRINCSLSLPDAQSEFAQEIGVSRWTIDTIYRGRMKGLRGRLRDAIQRHKVKFLRSQVTALERELALAERGMAPALTHDQRNAVVAQIAASKAVIAANKDFVNGKTKGE